MEFVIHRGKNKFIRMPVKFHADRSKFQFCTITTRSKLIIIFTRTVLPCLCFFLLNPAAEIMLSMLFNTLLKITPQNTQKRRRRLKKEHSKDLHDDIRRVTHPVPNLARQGLT